MEFDGVIALATGLATALATVGAATTFFRSRRQYTEAVQEIRNELPEATALSFEERQYALQREYHARSLAQSRQSFWFSLIAATVGFLVIISAVFSSLAGGSLGPEVAYVQVLAGAVIEAVSGLFFVQSNRARRLMSEFFDKLREDRKFEESLRLLKDGIPGPHDATVRAILALSFSGSVTPDLVSKFAVQVHKESDPSMHAVPAQPSGE